MPKICMWCDFLPFHLRQDLSGNFWPSSASLIRFDLVPCSMAGAAEYLKKYIEQIYFGKAMTSSRRRLCCHASRKIWLL